MTDNKKHLKIKKILKIIGPIVLVTGVALAIAGLVDFAINMRKFEQPKLFFLFFIGFPCIGVGSMLTAMGFKKEMMTYVKNEATPVFNEMGHDIAPGISAISNAVRNPDNVKRVCPVCGEENSDDNNFCKKCGNPLIKKCPSCNTVVEEDSAFCPNCGQKLEK